MIISSGAESNTNKHKASAQNASAMAEEMFIFGVTTGLFAFLTAIVFAARAKRYGQGYTASVETHGG